jgi:AcrR family transcriptional regulator
MRVAGRLLLLWGVVLVPAGKGERPGGVVGGASARGVQARGSARPGGVPQVRGGGCGVLGAGRVSGRGGSRVQLAAIQRSRLLSAAVGAVDELGYRGASVGHITARARVSRRTFYELFANREECLATVLEDTAARIAAEIAVELGAGGLGAGDGGSVGGSSGGGVVWRERVRVGLWVLLSFLDREPELARVCVVESARGGPVVRGCVEGILGSAAGVIDAGRLEGAQGEWCTALTAEGLVGAAFGILYARLSRPGGEPLRGLLGELMGLMVLPYLGSAAARRELARPAPRVLPGPVVDEGHERGVGDPFEGVRMRLTYRTARVLEGVAENPGASNRVVAEHAEVSDQGQISKLLGRLERLGLLVNGSGGHSRGEPNAWTLTVKGEQVTQSISLHSRVERAAA